MFLLVQTAQASENGALVYKSHRLAIDLVKKLRHSPPEGTYIMSMASDVAYKSSQESKKASLAYFAAFTELYSLAYPAERSWLQADLQPTGSDVKVVEKAKKKALKLWNKIEARFLEAKLPANPPWPAEGYKIGGWRPTPPLFLQPLLPNWGIIKTQGKFNIEKLLNTFKPVEYNSPLYMQELQEVYALGGRNSTVRTPEQSMIATFWTDSWIWIRTAVLILENKNVSFKYAADTMRTINRAASDAAIITWIGKYDSATIRPVSAIHDLLNDPTWLPYLGTPPFPSWTSAHSTLSMATAIVFDALILNGAPLELSSETVPNTTRTYAKAVVAAEEAGISRIYGGIHFEDDNRDGKAIGRLVGCKTLEKMTHLSCED